MMRCGALERGSERNAYSSHFYTISKRDEDEGDDIHYAESALHP